MERPPGDNRYQPNRPLYLRYLADVRALVERRAAEDDSLPIEDITDLVESNLFYVFQVAWDYRGLGIPFEDLLSEGNLGLIEAAHRFDRGRGVKFITYATWWVRKRILNLVARQMNLVRLPKYKSERLRKVRAEEKRLAASLGRSPTREELAKATALSLRELEDLRQLGHRELSLEQMVGEENGITLQDTIADEEQPEPEEMLIRRDYEEFVLDLVDRLPDQERHVVQHRFGFAGRTCLTLAQIGRHLGVSRERIRQIEMQALTRLRRFIGLPSTTSTRTNH
jgi:RNA polymerase sigma factor (sigma-70 family)